MHEEFRNSPNPSIILYTQPYCPACRRAKAFLAEYALSYQEFDVSEDYDARDDLWEEHGSQTTPTLVVDGEVFIGFRRQALVTKLRLGPPGKPAGSGSD